jgi:transposase
VDWNAVVAIGVDLGDESAHYVGLDGSGAVVARGHVRTRAVAFEAFFGAMPSKSIAIETGTHSPWVSRVLARLGHEVTVANSRRLRLIYENRNKSDAVDAEYLARLVRMDPKLLHPIEHRSETAQQHVAVFHARDVLVRTRSRLVTYVRGVIKSIGLRVPKCSVEAFVTKAKAVVPAMLEPALEPVLALVDDLNARIKDFDRRIDKLAATEYRDAAVLMQIKGVGALTAVAYMSTIGDRDRFAASRTLGPFLGLTPSRHGSGKSDPQLRITKQGDHYLRHLLVNCAQYILGPWGPDCDLRRHGQAIAARGGKNAKKRAVVAVARKLAVVMHRLWCTRAIYEPLRHSSSVVAA